MGISAFTLRLLLLFAPGILWSFILTLYTIHRERSLFFFSLQSLLFGLASYLVLWIASFATSCFTITFFEVLRDGDKDINPSEILLACIIAVVAGIVHCAIYNKKLINSRLRCIGVTKKYGNESVWSYFLNADNDAWVYARDLERNLCYKGYIDAYSDENDAHELLLKSVTVYRSSDGAELYHLKKVYLIFKSDCFSLEFPADSSKNETLDASQKEHEQRKHKEDEPAVCSDASHNAPCTSAHHSMRRTRLHLKDRDSSLEFSIENSQQERNNEQRAKEDESDH